jgi:hypothetical protein
VAVEGAVPSAEAKTGSSMVLASPPISMVPLNRDEDIGEVAGVKPKGSVPNGA